MYHPTVALIHVYYLLHDIALPGNGFILGLRHFVFVSSLITCFQIHIRGILFFHGLHFEMTTAPLSMDRYLRVHFYQMTSSQACLTQSTVYRPTDPDPISRR